MRRAIEILAIALTLLLALAMVAFCIYSPVTFMVITLVSSGCLFTYSTIQVIKYKINENTNRQTN
jgi:hypothetical protein